MLQNKPEMDFKIKWTNIILEPSPNKHSVDYQNEWNFISILIPPSIHADGVESQGLANDLARQLGKNDEHWL